MVGKLFLLIRKISLSKWALFFILSIFIFSFAHTKIWKRNQVFSSDSFIYYSYLPIAFYEKDYSLEFINKDTSSYYQNLCMYNSPIGHKYVKMTYGVALLEAPFFALAHITAYFCGYPQNGFSFPYELLCCISGLLYGLIGFLFLRKVLLNFFSELITALSIVIIAFGTNLFHYLIYSPTMSHSFNFCLFAVFIFVILKWLDKPNTILSIYTGLLYGLIVLIRPSNAIIIVFPLLYDVRKFQDIKDRFRFFIRNYKHIIIIIILTFIVFVPQMLYWYKVSGQFVLYSYSNEKFFFSNPHLIYGLFGYRKGWLIYTPIMSFSIIGFIFLYLKMRKLFWSVFLFTLLNIYIIFSWWCWWYGGSFGARAMIESYALLAFPLASFISFITKKLLVSIPVMLIAGFLIFLNIFQSYQCSITLIHWDSMSKKAYWGVFLKKTWPNGYSDMLRTPDYENASKNLPEEVVK